jgi:hypothetical protein
MEWISVDKLPPQTGAYLITDGRMIGEGYWSPAIGCYSAIDRRRRTLFSTCGHAFDCGSMNTKCPASADTQTAVLERSDQSGQRRRTDLDQRSCRGFDHVGIIVLKRGDERRHSRGIADFTQPDCCRFADI